MQERFIQGRGSQRNPQNRFTGFEQIPELSEQDESEDLHAKEEIKTRFYKDTSKTIITENKSPDVGFMVSINPYRGCEHGCIYCYARPTHEYLDLSAGLDFETKIFVKEDAPELLRKKLSSASWQPQVISMSGVTDPYQPVEQRLQLTRRCLDVLREFRNPVGIITKNYLVTRDIDILQELASFNAVRVFVSVTTLNADLAAVMEPRTSRPLTRLNAIKQLREAGVPVSVMMAPIIPGITDHEIASVLEAAAEAGAQSAYYTMLRLPYAVKDLFSDWLAHHFPDRRNKVLNRIKEIRNGQLNNSEFGTRMRGEGVMADNISQLFKLARKKYGLNGQLPALSTDSFHRPGNSQLSLF